MTSLAGNRRSQQRDCQLHLLDELPAGEVVHDGAANSAAEVDPRNQLNELTASQWMSESVSVWLQRGLGAGHPEAQIERQHPAPFSFSDVARLVRFFTKPKGTVLDPFVGVGSTLKACALEGRVGIGFELNPVYAQLARTRIQQEVRPDAPTRDQQTILEGDARSLMDGLANDSIDFVVTSPPYASILHKENHKARQERRARGLDTRYSDDPADLGNIRDYDLFLEAVAGILGSCSRPLKHNKYMAVVVGDFRDRSRYVMFHADLARALEPYRFGLRGIIVLYQRHKRVFPYGYPFSYVPNIHNQFILVLQNDGH